MATTKLKGKHVELFGDLPEKGTGTPEFDLVNSELNTESLSKYKNNNLMLNIFPSIDTPVCALSVRKFNEKANNLSHTKVLGISMDLPFALQRYCAAEGLKNIIPLSAFRDPSFGKYFGLLITSGPLKGLLARAVLIINKQGKLIYSQLVPDISQEPNYDDVLNNLNQIMH